MSKSSKFFSDCYLPHLLIARKSATNKGGDIDSLYLNKSKTMKASVITLLLPP